MPGLQPPLRMRCVCCAVQDRGGDPALDLLHHFFSHSSIGVLGQVAEGFMVWINSHDMP